jgi:hypothetical protein
MSRAVLLLCVVLSLFCPAAMAQFPGEPRLSMVPLALAGDPDPRGAADPNPAPSGGGGGQVVYSAERGGAFSRFAGGATVSTLGIGLTAGTNLSPRVDLRLFGNYTNLTHRFSNSGFRVALNIGMANAGASVDFYPLRRFPLRISPGYLYLNQNRLAGSLHAQRNATFTINNVDYASDNANPVHGSGKLTLGGTGFMATAGIGHIVSRSRRRFTFPFEAGVVFINTPVAQFNLQGNICNQSVPSFCTPAAEFPTFADNLAAQLKTWNQQVAPYHIYPIIQGGFAYSFTLRRRGYE